MTEQTAAPLLDDYAIQRAAERIQEGVLPELVLNLIRDTYERDRALAAERERGLREEVNELRAIIAYIDKHVPRADATCVEPGITLSEATRRAIADERKVSE